MNADSLLRPLYEKYLKMQCTEIPTHIAIIQDGNRRFAREMGIDTAKGHRAGADKTEEMLDWAHELGIRYITLYTFSTENFRRSEDEVRDLFQLFKETFLNTVTDKRVHKYRIRVQMVGDRSLLPADLKSAIEAAEEATKDYDGFVLNIALAYGGRNEIVLAAREIVADVRNGKIAPRGNRRPDGRVPPPRRKRHPAGRSYYPDGKRLPDLELPSLACKRPRIGRLFLRPVLAALP